MVVRSPPLVEVDDEPPLEVEDEPLVEDEPPAVVGKYINGTLRWINAYTQVYYQDLQNW